MSKKRSKRVSKIEFCLFLNHFFYLIILTYFIYIVILILHSLLRSLKTRKLLAKKIINFVKIRNGKFLFKFKPYILKKFAYNFEQFLDSLFLFIKNLHEFFMLKGVIFRFYWYYHLEKTFFIFLIRFQRKKTCK